MLTPRGSLPAWWLSSRLCSDCLHIALSSLDPVPELWPPPSCPAACPPSPPAGCRGRFLRGLSKSACPKLSPPPARQTHSSFAFAVSVHSSFILPGVQAQRCPDPHPPSSHPHLLRQHIPSALFNLLTLEKSPK
uniref:cDNA FLJ61754 n=1 Tax=Homo sapiens TaxID=9606 RepID=B4E073_HUMAN|nr:unnamed protein product [Homo sapiens]